jgi:pentatricopeptide repeat protein
MITWYNHNSRYDEALRTFQQMMLEGRFMPDEATLVSVVSSCAHLGSAEYSNWITSYISKSNTYITVALGNALIDMFAKCGDVGRAWLVFGKMKTRCIITWTTMISGFAFNGQFREALLIYNDMCKGVQLDSAVFVVALAACAHGGLLQDGWSIFKQMAEHYHITPRMEHYGCMVDLLARAGNLQEAIEFIESMPLKPGIVLWVSLLSSCIAHGDAELIDYVSKKVVEMEPFHSSYQVLVSNCSALEGRWGSVMDARKMMRNLGMEKVPGSSLIQVGSEVHEFLAKDTRHQKRKEIYEMLDGLISVMKHAEHVPFVTETSVFRIPLLRT